MLPTLRRRGVCGWCAFVRSSDGAAWPAPCKSWSCRWCSRRMARAWTKRLEENGFVPRVFLTVTIDPAELEKLGIALDDYVQQRAWLLDRLRCLWQWARRQGTLRYFRVYEWHRGELDGRRWRRDGCPEDLGPYENHRLHMHALVETEVPGGGVKDGGYRQTRDRWRAQAIALGLGRESRAYSLPADASVNAVRRYVLKYTCKRKSAAHRYRVRLVAASRGLGSRKPRSEKGDSGVTRLAGLRQCSAPEALLLGHRPWLGHWSRLSDDLLGTVPEPALLVLPVQAWAVGDGYG